MIKLTPIKPKATAQTFRAVRAAAMAATQQAAKALVADYEKTTATWKTDVRWTVTVSANGVLVRTDNQIWKFVDQGTRPHEIRAKAGKALRFAQGYTAKTRPGSIIARSGSPSGDDAFARSVQHPGTKARGFTTRLRAKWKEKWPKDMQAAITKAVRA